MIDIFAICCLLLFVICLTSKAGEDTQGSLMFSRMYDWVICWVPAIPASYSATYQPMKIGFQCTTRLKCFSLDEKFREEDDSVNQFILEPLQHIPLHISLNDMKLETDQWNVSYSASHEICFQYTGWTAINESNKLWNSRNFCFFIYLFIFWNWITTFKGKTIILSTTFLKEKKIEKY